MLNDLTIIMDFLARSAGEVEGHILTEPPAEVARKLRSFARGELPPTDRESLVQLLNTNPDWVPWLVEEIKRLRPPTRGIHPVGHQH